MYVDVENETSGFTSVHIHVHVVLRIFLGVQ